MKRDQKRKMMHKRANAQSQVAASWIERLERVFSTRNVRATPWMIAGET